MEDFDRFWAVYPPRQGSKNKAEAEKRFNIAIKKGADPSHIISSARRYADEQRAQNNENTPFVCMASTWLNQRRWLDYAPDMAAQVERDERLDIFMTDKGYIWNGQRWEKVNKKPPREAGADNHSPDTNVTS